MSNFLRQLPIKLLLLFSNLIAIILITFIMVELSPIDPVQSYLGAATLTVSPEQKARIAEYWGLNQPLFQRILDWFLNILRGDFGVSMTSREAVLEIIWSKFQLSFIVLFISWLMSGLLGYILGVISGYYHNSLLDKLIKLYCMIMNSSPSFWIGFLLMYFLAMQLGWLPVALSTPIGVASQDVTFMQRLSHAMLPILTLILTGMSDRILYTRQQVIEIKQSEAVIFAQAKGESDRQIIRYHILKPALLINITLQFTSIASLLSGTVIIEEIFSYPGLGQATVAAGLSGDMPLLLGIVFFTAILVNLGQWIAEYLLNYVDPRLGWKRRSAIGE